VLLRDNTAEFSRGKIKRAKFALQASRLAIERTKYQVMVLILVHRFL